MKNSLADGEPSAGVVKHSLVIAGHRTSVSLEAAFWRALTSLAVARRQSIAGLVAEIDATRGRANLSSAIRVYLIERAGLSSSG
jgi:predicted DNA-binding ribbon-helix-helix protein